MKPSSSKREATMLIEPQFRTPEADAVWSAEARVGRMMEFEAALAAAQAEQGLVPDSAAAAIGTVAGTGPVDADVILNAAATAGNPAIPFVKAFTAAVR